MPSGVKSECLAYGSIDQSGREEPTQAGKRPGLAAHCVAESRVPGDDRLEDNLCDELRLLAGVNSFPNHCRCALAGAGVIADGARSADSVGRDLRLDEARLDENRPNTKGTNFVVECLGEPLHRMLRRSVDSHEWRRKKSSHAADENESPALLRPHRGQ